MSKRINKWVTEWHTQTWYGKWETVSVDLTRREGLETLRSYQQNIQRPHRLRSHKHFNDAWLTEWQKKLYKEGIAVYYGGKAEAVLNSLLATVPTDNGYEISDDMKERGFRSRCVGVYESTEGGKERWVAFDNTTGDCWVEEYRSQTRAWKYVTDIEVTPQK